jgi:hypothetical protein
MISLICLTTRHEGALEEKRYSSYSFSTSALDAVSGQLHACRGSDLDLPVVQPIARHYTD